MFHYASRKPPTRCNETNKNIFAQGAHFCQINISRPGEVTEEQWVTVTAKAITHMADRKTEIITSGFPLKKKKKSRGCWKKKKKNTAAGIYPD